MAELRNFSKAAEKLGYSQSAVTIQIQQLERELGVQLFERIGKGEALTEEGQSFVFYANEILEAAEKAKESIRNRTAGYLRAAPDWERRVCGDSASPRAFDALS